MIQEIANRIEKKKSSLERWIQEKWRRLPPPPVYSSLDLRNAGFKISVVDTNLFPAGFNNLCETFSGQASAAFRGYFQRLHPKVKKILIFPEEHTRNLHYWRNVLSLQTILQQAGFETRVGTAAVWMTGDRYEIKIDEGTSISLSKINVVDRRLETPNFVPDLVLINNDLSAGTPEYLRDLDQPLLPSPHLGWHRRRKSDHFKHYKDLIQEGSSLLEIDPWLLSPFDAVEKGIDLSDEICLNRLAESANRLLNDIHRKYLDYNIRQKPYLFVKSNSGTYGMGIIHVESGKDLLSLNRRMRNKLESGKGGQRVSEYLLQEGIPTADLYRGVPLEPVVYLVGGEAIGNFFRIHEQKNSRESLNAPGMAFGCLCLHKVEPPKRGYQLTYQNKEELFAVASLLGRIASLAASLEQGEIAGKAAAERHFPSL